MELRLGLMAIGMIGIILELMVFIQRGFASFKAYKTMKFLKIKNTNV